MPSKSRLKTHYKEPSTGKRKAFVKERLDNPTEPVSTSVRKAGYNPKDIYSASAIGHKLMKEPQIIMALGKHNELFESAIVGTVRDWQNSETPRKREIALNAAMFGHDKVHGKATVKLEQQSTIVRININLTGDGDDAPPPELLDDPLD